MNIELGRIIQQALPLVEKQVGERYDKYVLEKELRWHNPRPVEYFENVMPQIVARWAVDDSQILLLEVMHHDLHARALPFTDISELETHMLSGSSFLNGYVTYVIPIVGGEVKAFEVITSQGVKIVKHLFDETSTLESIKHCRMDWKT